MAPTSLGGNGKLSTADVVDALRLWRNHWAEVHRIYEDFPDDIQRQVIVRPTDMDEALRATRAQFAVLFHPDTMVALVHHLDQLLEKLELVEEIGGR